MLFTLLGVLGHFPFVFPLGFKCVAIEKVDRQMVRRGNVNTSYLLPKGRLFKFIQPHGFST